MKLHIVRYLDGYVGRQLLTTPDISDTRRFVWENKKLSLEASFFSIFSELCKLLNIMRTRFLIPFLGYHLRNMGILV